MQKVLFTIIFSFLLIFNFTLMSSNVLAVTAQETAISGLDETAGEANLEQGDPATTIGAAIGVLLGVLSVVLLVIVVYAGVTWMTAGGKEDVVKKSRSMLIEAVLGLLVCLLAYSFTTFVVERLATVTSGT
ncbi:hypothetical protein KKC32_05360 [Patescibacteria group bacterium]|nr:hypothetical protein [Patescibacteria group bacterium]